VLLADIPEVGSPEAAKLEDAKPSSYEPLFLAPKCECLWLHAMESTRVAAIPSCVAHSTAADTFVAGATWVFPEDLTSGGGAGGGGGGDGGGSGGEAADPEDTVRALMEGIATFNLDLGGALGLGDGASGGAAAGGAGPAAI